MVTLALALWVQHRVHPYDLVGYVIAQCVGGLAGAAVVRGLWESTAVAVRHGARRRLRSRSAGLLEAAMTATLVVMLLMFTSSHP